MTKTGEVTVDQSEILDASKEYYKSLYKSTCPETKILKTYIETNPIDHSLNPCESKQVDGKLTLEELTSSIYNMKVNKTPGKDGLTVEFYRQFWPTLKHIVLNVSNTCYDNETLSDTQKIGIISLI